jgi:hypothetical protein
MVVIIAVVRLTDMYLTVVVAMFWRLVWILKVVVVIMLCLGLWNGCRYGGGMVMAGG